MRLQRSEMGRRKSEASDESLARLAARAERTERVSAHPRLKQRGELVHIAAVIWAGRHDLGHDDAVREAVAIVDAVERWCTEPVSNESDEREAAR